MKGGKMRSTKSVKKGANPKSDGSIPAEVDRRSSAGTLPKAELAKLEVLDDPNDSSVTPIEPRCRKCGGTFSTEADLIEHAKTCKGGHEPPPRRHLR
jgi:hypothetical protein